MTKYSIENRVKYTLQMTTANGNKEKKYGSRNPAVFIKGNKLHIAAAINGNHNHHYDVPKALEAGKWYSINIEQTDIDVKDGYKGVMICLQIFSLLQPFFISDNLHNYS